MRSSIEFGSRKKTNEKRRRVRSGLNPEGTQMYRETVDFPHLKPGEIPAAPETPPAPKVPAQKPSGNWNPDVDTSNQEWTDK